MNKKFILALMLTTGMAFAQTGSSGSTTPDQQPSQQPSPAALDQSIHLTCYAGPDEFNSHQHQRSIQFTEGLPETVRRELGACC